MSVVPREFFWDLAMPTPRFFMSPFTGDMHQHMMQDMVKTEQAMGKMYDNMMKDLQKTMGEIQPTGRQVQVKHEANRLEIDFDVHDYKPEELVVKTDHHVLMVHGKHEEKDDKGHKYTKREFTHKFMLPKEVDPMTVVSSLKEGKLCVEAPKKALPAPAERQIPIDNKK